MEKSANPEGRTTLSHRREPACLNSAAGWAASWAAGWAAGWAAKVGQIDLGILAGDDGELGLQAAGELLSALDEAEDLYPPRPLRHPTDVHPVID